MVYPKASLLLTEGGRVTLDKVLTTMDILKLHYSKTLGSLSTTKTNQNLRARVVRSHTKFEEYYAKLFSTPLYATAVILHPSCRTRYCEAIWSKETYDKALWQAKQFWEKYRREAPPIVSYDERLSQRDRLDESKDLDAFDCLEAQLQEQYLRPQSQDELDNYLAEVSYGLKVGDPIQWWLGNGQVKRWPQLSLFAVNILSIPAMSNKPEVVFSGGRRTIGWERVQLGADTLEVTECEKDWIRSGILRSSF
jgi:hypothetical protein